MWRKYGGERLYFIDCEHAQFNDPTDTQEWCDKIDAGHITTVPCGSVDFASNSARQISQQGCQPNMVTEVLSTLSYQSYETEPEYKDETFWKSLHADCSRFRVLACDCSGGILMDANYACFIKEGRGTIEGKNIGINYGFTSTPKWGEGDAGLEVWSLQMSFISHPSQCPERVYLPEVKAILEEKLLCGTTTNRSRSVPPVLSIIETKNPNKWNMDGSATLQVLRGEAPYRFEWVGAVNGARTIKGDTLELTALGSGDYTVVVTDAKEESAFVGFGLVKTK